MSLFGLRARLLSRFAAWALAKNPGGGYAGEDDERWAYTIRGDDGSPYLTRILLTRTFVLRWLKELTGLGVYVHHFHRPDGDQEMHDHPWKHGASLVLNGAYVEERVDQVVDVVDTDYATYSTKVRKVLTDTKLVRWTNYLTGSDFHAVRSLQGDVWTLFFTHGRFQDWGFLVDGAKVPWREYLVLNPAKDYALDNLGASLRDPVFREAEVTAHPDGDLSWSYVEPDAEYRERIRTAMRAQAKEELT